MAGSGSLVVLSLLNTGGFNHALHDGGDLRGFFFNQADTLDQDAQHLDG